MKIDDDGEDALFDEENHLQLLILSSSRSSQHQLYFEFQIYSKHQQSGNQSCAYHRKEPCTSFELQKRRAFDIYEMFIVSIVFGVNLLLFTQCKAFRSSKQSLLTSRREFFLLLSAFWDKENK